MQKTLFGDTGLRVSRVALGTMTFGTSWGWGADREESGRMLGAFLDGGGNFVDTANKYTDGEAERFLGELLGRDRRRVVLATKYSLLTDASDANSLGNHRRSLVTAVEDSLERLQTDYIDLLYVHAWYHETRISDVVRALDDLVRSGKVLFWGMSDTPAWVCAEAAAVAEVRGWAPLSALQLELSLVERTAERELLPFARHRSIGVTGSIPLAGGLLSGKHQGRGSPDSLRGDRAAGRRTERIDGIVEGVVTGAMALGISPAQLALAWLLSRFPGSVPVLGARSVAQLQENLAALAVEVPDDTLAVLDELSAIEFGFPHDMLAGARMREVMYGPFDPR